MRSKEVSTVTNGEKKFGAGRHTRGSMSSTSEEVPKESSDEVENIADWDEKSIIAPIFAQQALDSNTVVQTVRKSYAGSFFLQ